MKNIDWSTVLLFLLVIISVYKLVKPKHKPMPVTGPDYWRYAKLGRHIDLYVKESEREWFRGMFTSGRDRANAFLFSVYGEVVNFDEVGIRELLEYVDSHFNNSPADKDRN